MTDKYAMIDDLDEVKTLGYIDGLMLDFEAMWKRFDGLSREQQAAALLCIVISTIDYMKTEDRDVILREMWKWFYKKVREDCERAYAAKRAIRTDQRKKRSRLKPSQRNQLLREKDKKKAESWSSDVNEVSPYQFY